MALVKKYYTGPVSSGLHSGLDEKAILHAGGRIMGDKYYPAATCSLCDKDFATNDATVDGATQKIAEFLCKEGHGTMEGDYVCPTCLTHAMGRQMALKCSTANDPPSSSTPTKIFKPQRRIVRKVNPRKRPLLDMIKRKGGAKNS